MSNLKIIFLSLHFSTLPLWWVAALRRLLPVTWHFKPFLFNEMCRDSSLGKIIHIHPTFSDIISIKCKGFIWAGLAHFHNTIWNAGFDCCLVCSSENQEKSFGISGVTELQGNPRLWLALSSYNLQLISRELTGFFWMSLLWWKHPGHGWNEMGFKVSSNSSSHLGW